MTTTTASTIAAHPITLSIYDGYMMPRRNVVTTLGAMLGADHIAWILEQNLPSATATCRARGQWDANNLEMCDAYTELSRLLAA